ncbi:hypothetical protein IE53DRAFT_362922 [Violaceomyces palustris]|uniref:Uncharacterized protein n=1 Tax=Violaceomyces palustris TaxID=1673888 RepID=A0ACD0NV86_9BASI|nr:hypothetical protein IE53DRAFT_362922 [Violaceomyces palustris]
MTPSPSTSRKRSKQNLHSIFLAQFHYRRGNEILFQHPPPSPILDLGDPVTAPIDLSKEEAIEWKVLPSGSHSVERDRLHFSLGDRFGRQDGKSQSLFGMSCFRKVRIPSVPCTTTTTESAEDGKGVVSVQSSNGSSSSSKATELDKERGARMISVGVIMVCEDDSVGEQLRCQLQHVQEMERIADSLASEADRQVGSDHGFDLQILIDYYEKHRYQDEDPATGETTEDAANLTFARRGKSTALARMRNGRFLDYDPMSYLPATCGALGPLLPQILKSLLLPGHRLLIFSPLPLRNASYVAYNLAELLQQATLRSPQGQGRSRRRGGGGRSDRDQPATSNLIVRGLIGLHDIAKLEKEKEAHRKVLKSGSDQIACKGWIAWTSDRILLEKLDLFDSLLDLTTLQSPSSTHLGSGGIPSPSYLPSDSANGGGSKLAKFSKVVKTQGNGSSGTKRLGDRIKKQTWTTREFATFNELDSQAERHSLRSEHHHHRRYRRRGGSVGIEKRGKGEKRSQKFGSMTKTKMPRSGRGRGNMGFEEDGQEALRVSGRAGQEDSSSDENSMVVSVGGGGFFESCRGGGGGAGARRGGGRMKMMRKKRTALGMLSALLAFLRYWLAGWWFLPSHWKYGLPSGYVLPLGIRGDGGVRSSLLILPDSQSETESEEDQAGRDDSESESETASGSWREQEVPEAVATGKLVDIALQEEVVPDLRSNQATPEANDIALVQVESGEGAEEVVGSSSKARGGGGGDGGLTPSSVKVVEGSTKPLMQSSPSFSSFSSVSTLSSSSSEENDGPPDPLLAAVGASQPIYSRSPGSRRRSFATNNDQETFSRSPTSIRSRNANVAGGGGGGGGGGRRSRSKASSKGSAEPVVDEDPGPSPEVGGAAATRSFSGEVEEEEEEERGSGKGKARSREQGSGPPKRMGGSRPFSSEEDDVDGGEEEEDSLSTSLYIVWTRWCKALVKGLEKGLVLKTSRFLETLGREEVGGGGEGEEEEEERPLLMTADDDRTVDRGRGHQLEQEELIIEMSQKEVAELGLSCGNDLDVQLVESLCQSFFLSLSSQVVQGVGGGRRDDRLHHLDELEKLIELAERRKVWFHLGGEEGSERRPGFLSVRVNVKVDRGWPMLRWFM